MFATNTRIILQYSCMLITRILRKRKRDSDLPFAVNASLISSLLRTSRQMYPTSRRYKAEIEEPKGSIHMTSRSVRSDVYFAEDEEKKTRTGSYDVNPQPVNGDGEGSRSRGSSGDYDFPDPYPGGKRTTHYDNPGLQKV